MVAPYIQTAEEIVRDALVRATNDLLEVCSDDQVALFHRIQNSAPWKGFENCKGSDLINAYELVRRTVLKNRSGRPVSGATS